MTPGGAALVGVAGLGEPRPEPAAATSEQATPMTCGRKRIRHNGRHLRRNRGLLAAAARLSGVRADRPGRHPRATLAVAPVALALVLLSIAVLSNGAFALRQWGPIAFFGLVDARVRAAEPAARRRRWRSSPRRGAFALWSLLSVDLGRRARPGGRGRGAQPALRRAGQPAAADAAGPALGAADGVDADRGPRRGRDPDLRQRAVRTAPAQFLAGRLNDPGRLPQRDRGADGDGVLAAGVPRRAARAEPAAARGRVQRRHHGARARVPDAVARRADRLRLRRGRRARARARPRCAARG